MSIEQRLTDELKRQGASIQCPDTVAVRIEQLFDQRFSGKRFRNAVASVASRPRRYSQAIVVAVCLLLFSGIAYASTLLYQINEGAFSFRVSSNTQTHTTFDPQQAKILREQTERVRQQLAPGESALLYVPEMNKLKLPPLLKVNQPQRYTDMESWKKQLVGSVESYQFPNILPEGFAFMEGRTALPIGGINADIVRDNLEKMKNLSKDQAAGITWHKFAANESESPTASELEIPNLIYQNAAGDQIHIQYQILPENEKEKTIQAEIPGLEQVEKVSLNGRDAYFAVNHQAFLSSSNQSKALTWIVKKNGLLILYAVSSESAGVSKQDLVFTAEHMK